jgi:phosphoenolpyruvate---glycerone phosphotransferase subunit DhaL
MSATMTRADVMAWLRAFAADVAERRDELTDLDAAIGDADHGTNMDRGMKAVVARLDEGAGVAGGIGALVKTAGMTLVSTVGGAAGPLYGTFFLRMAAAAGERDELTTTELAAAFAAAVDGVQARGKAVPGDKTMVDALVPAAGAFAAAAAADLRPGEAFRRAAEAAEEGMKATVPLVARKGRASYLGERSAGHQDPGATSSWLLVAAGARTLAGDAPGGAAEGSAKSL